MLLYLRFLVIKQINTIPMKQTIIQPSNNLCNECKIFEVTNLIITCSCKEKSLLKNSVSPMFEIQFQQLSLDSEINLEVSMQLESENTQRNLLESEVTKSSTKNSKPRKNVHWGPRSKNVKRGDNNFNKKYAKRIQYALSKQPKWFRTKISGYMKYKNSPFCHYLIANLYKSRQKLEQFRQTLFNMEKQFKAEITDWGVKHNRIQQSLTELELLNVQLRNLHYYIEYDTLPSITAYGLKVIALKRDQLLFANSRLKINTSI